MRFLKLPCHIPGIAFISLFLLLVSPRYATGSEASRFLPNTAGIQKAGYIGWICGGTGYLFWDRRIEASFWYGYVPASKGGKSIHTFAIRNLAYPVKFNFLQIAEISPYAGTTVLFALDRNLYWSKSTDVPGKHRYYYPPTGIHAAANAGFLLSMPYGSLRHGFYIELTMLDTYIKAYIWDDRDHLSFFDCASMAIGYKLVFQE